MKSNVFAIGCAEPAKALTRPGDACTAERIAPPRAIGKVTRDSAPHICLHYPLFTPIIPHTPSKHNRNAQFLPRPSAAFFMPLRAEGLTVPAFWIII